MVDLLFLLVVSFLFAHEMDAIAQDEWRFFGALLSLGDEASYRFFVAAHIPLFIFIVWYSDTVWLQTGLSVFAIVHVGLHWFLRDHPLIAFDNRFSWLWIGGSGLFAALYLIAAYLL